MSDSNDDRLAKQRETERLERELAHQRAMGRTEEVAALEHELADLLVRDVDSTPSEMLGSGVLEPDVCIACGTTLVWIGRRGFRFGGPTGLGQVFLGEWAELDEEKLELEVWACPDCRRVELRMPPQA